MILRPFRIQAERDWHTLPTFRSSNGDVHGRGTSLYHHANWQMVEQRIFALHKKAGGAVLASCSKKDAHF